MKQTREFENDAEWMKGLKKGDRVLAYTKGWHVRRKFVAEVIEGGVYIADRPNSHYRERVTYGETRTVLLPDTEQDLAAAKAEVASYDRVRTIEHKVMKIRGNDKVLSEVERAIGIRRKKTNDDPATDPS